MTMLPLLLPGWRVAYLADGIALFSPRGRGHGGIRIRDRRRPMLSLSELVAARVDEMDSGEHELGSIERAITSEGEYAALVTITSRQGSERFVRDVAFLFGDDFYTQIDGGTADPALAPVVRDAVRALVARYGIGLGELRPRRFLYEPPPAWSGYARGLTTDWQPPGFPNEAASISVFPARPARETSTHSLDRALHELGWHGFVLADRKEPTPILNRHHLVGVHWRIAGHYPDGREHCQDVVVLQDDRFHYVARLESSHDRIASDRETFLQLIDSIEPIPRPRMSRGADHQALGHWTE